MDDLISRQAAIDALKEERCPCESDYDEGYLSMLDKAIWIMQEWLPSAQPENKRGKWIFIRGEEAGNALYECSACGKGDIHAPEVRVSYCWNCGAQMGEEA